MKRPLALCGFSCLAASCFASLIGTGSLISAIVCLLFGLGFLLVPRFRRTPVLVVCLLLCAAQFFAGYLRLQALTQWTYLDETDAHLTGVVLEDTQKSGTRFRCTVSVESLTTEQEPITPKRLLVRLSVNQPLRAGDHIDLSAWLYLPDDSGGFSVRSAAYAQNLALYAYGDDFEPLTRTPGTDSFFAALRRTLVTSLENRMPKQEAALTSGVVFGQKDEIADEVTDSFRSVGASHLLVVSGIHMSVVAGCLLRLLSRQNRRPGRLSALLACIGILLFMGITGGTPSVVRSGIMCLAGLFATQIHARYDAFSALGLAMLVLCLVNPLAGGQIGLVLSFLCVLGILLLWPVVSRFAFSVAIRCGKLERPVQWILQSIGVSVSATLITLPIQALFLGGISILSPLSSVVLIPIATLLLPLGLLTAILGCVPILSGVTRLFAFLCGLLSKIMSAFAIGLDEAFPWGYLPARGWMIPAAAGVLLLIALCVLIGGKRRARIACAVMSAVIVAVSFTSWQIANRDTVRFAITGSGDVAVFTDGQAFVPYFTGEDSYTLSQALSENGTDKLMFFCLPSEKDAIRDAAAEVLRETPVYLLALPDGAYADDKLLRLTAADPLRYDTNTALSLSYGDIQPVCMQGEWTVLFQGGSFAPCEGGFRLENENGDPLFISIGGSVSKEETTLTLSEEEIVYIDRLPDGTCRFRRSNGWPK